MLPWMERSGLWMSCVLVAALVTGLTNAANASASETFSENFSEAETAKVDSYPLSAFEENELSKFQEPSPSKSHPFSQFHLDPKGIVPRSLLTKALDYYQTNLSLLGNRNYLAVINYAARSTQKRLFIINMATGAVQSFHVAHGAGSDRDGDGYANQFSNTNDSNMSSLGFFRSGETYNGAHGRSLRLDGLSGTNSNARTRAIVIHGADYVKDAGIVQGRSWGCPAVSMRSRDKVVNLLKGGAIIYAGLAN
jgi:L,D-transpeptidase catalytic domain